MIRPVALFLIGMIAVHAAPQLPNNQYSSSVGEQSNVISPSPSLSPSSKSYNTPQQASYVAIPSAVQHSVTPSPSPIPKFYSSLQQNSFVPQQQPQYFVVPTHQQPGQYVSQQQPGQYVSQQSTQYVPQQPLAYSAFPSGQPQPVSYSAIPSGVQQPQPVSYSAIPSGVQQPQPVSYSAIPSGLQQPQQVSYSAIPSQPQPTPFVSASPKFYSASVAAAQPILSDGSSTKFASAPAAVAQPALSETISPKFLSTSVVAAPSVVPASPVPVAAKVVPQVQVKSGIADKDAQIVQEGREVGYDGTFNYGFDTENGISVKSKGYTKPAATPNDEPIQVIEGSYTFVDAYGKLQTIHYIADELGYRAYGDGIPQPHEEILKSLAHRR